MTDNPFEAFGQTQMHAAAKRKYKRAEKRAEDRVKLYASDKDAPMVPGAQEKKQREQQRQYRNYRRHKRAEIRTLLEGKYRIHWLQFSRVLRRLTIEDGQALIDYIDQAQWLVGADRVTRYIALAAVSDKIVKLRIQNGYDPFDDSLPGQMPTVYEIIRQRLSG